MFENQASVLNVIFGHLGASWARFGVDFGVIWGSIWGSRARVAILAKSMKNAVLSMTFVVPEGPKTGPKLVPKQLPAATWLQEWLGGLLGPILGHFWIHFGPQNRSQNGPKSKLEFEAIFE